MKEMRIGIIGAGVISHRHMTVWSKIPQAKIVAVADVDEKKLAAWSARYGVSNSYRNFRDLLKRDDIDAVDVCVHNNLHVPISLEVMRAGKHCYCEKPMAGSYADAKLLYDAQKVYGKKLAIQISSIYNLQTRMARDMITRGELGKVYHMRSVGSRRKGRPGLDMKGLSPDFYSKFYAEHGALFDMGVYHISQLLFVTGIPKLESVYGATYQEVEIDERLLEGRKFEVEELGVGLAKYEGGLSLDIIEPWAINIDKIGDTFIAGSKGGLKFLNVDSGGGKLARSANMPMMGAREPELYFYGYQNGREVDVDLRCASNARAEEAANPGISIYNDNHLHWMAYLSGDLSDETRYDTPWLALNTMLVSEGLFLSGQLGRSVTAEEIAALSKSTAIRRQQTDWGVLEYEL